MKKRGLVLGVLVISFIFLISFISAATITDDLHVNIQTTNATGTVETGSFAFVFNVSNSSNCSDTSGIIYSNSTSLTTDTRGIISYYLPAVTLDYDVQYWLCYYRDSVLESSSKIAKTPYAFRAQNVTLTGVEIDSNLDMGTYNVSASWFKGLFNWTVNAASNLWLTFTGSELSFNETQLNRTINASIDLKASDLNVNRSEWWATSEGSLDDVSDISGSWIVNDLSWMNWTQIDNGTFAYVGEPLWTGNYTAYNDSWSSTYNSTYQTAYEFTTNGTFMDASTDNWVNESGDTMTGDLIMSGANITNVSYLGVGTTTPAADIEVSKQGGSAIRLTDSTAGNMYLQMNNTQINMMREADSMRGFIISTQNAGAWNTVNLDAGDIIFKPNNTEVLRLDIAGNVGVGSSSPNYKLEVAGDLNVSNAFFVDSSGRVGIGSASPQNALNVIGTGNVTSNFTVDETTFHVDATGNKVGIGTLGPRSTLEVAGSGGSDIRIANSQDVSKYLLLNQTYISMVRETASTSGLKIQTINTGSWGGTPTSDSGDIIFLPNASEAMRIDLSGNVGIGTSTPQNKLNVVGDANVTGTLYLNNNNVSDTYVPYTGAIYNVALGVNNFSVNTNTLFVNKENSRVGIGTVSPGSDLEIAKTDGANLRVSDVVANKYLQLNNSDIYMVRPDASVYALTIGTLSTGAWSSGSINSGDIIFKPNNTEALRIDQGGNVGIGTTKPQNKLNVVGDGNFTTALYVNEKNVETGYDFATNGTYYLNSNPSTFWNTTYYGGIGNWTLDKPNYYTILQIENNFTNYYTSAQVNALPISTFTNDNSYYNSTTLTTNSQLENGNNYWNDTFATFNKTYADTIYSGIEWDYNQTTPAINAVLGFNYWNTTYYGGIGNFSAWDKDYDDLINAPLYLSNFTDDLGDRGYTSLSNFTNNMGYYNSTTLTMPVIQALNFYNTTETDTQIENANTSMASYVDALNVSQASWVSTNYVPYSGANSNTNLGIYNLTTSGRLTAGVINATSLIYQNNNLVLDTATSFGGDVSGTYNTIVVADDSHLHDAVNITNEYWVNESGDTMTGNLTAPNFIGKFYGTYNWTTSGNYLSFDGSTLDFSEAGLNGTINNSIDLRQGILNVNSSNYWDNYDVASDLNNLIILDWANITNKFITAVNGTYIYMSGTIATLNETKLNTTINLIDAATNTSMKNYVDAQDISYNSSMFTYVNAQDVIFNDSIASYVNSQDIIYNTTMTNFVTATNTSMKNYVVATYYNKTTSDLRLDNASIIRSWNTSWITNNVGNFSAWDKDYADLIGTPTLLSNFSNDLGIGNWTLDKINYYNISQVETNFTNYFTASQINSFDYYNATNLQNVSQLVNDFSYYNSTSLTTNSQLLNGNNYWNNTFATFNKTYADTIYYDLGNSFSYYNSTSLQNVSQLANDFTYWNTTYYGGIGNWTADQPNYYNTTEINDINLSMASFVEANYLRNDGDNGTGTYNFGGSYIDGGVTIKDGAIYAQTGYFYNITSLAITHLDINGSILPTAGYDNDFDLGSGSLRWRNLYVGTNAYVNGSIYQDGNVVLDTRYNSLSNFTNNLGIGNWTADSGNYYNTTQVDAINLSMKNYVVANYYNKTTSDERLDNASIIRSWNTSWITNNVGNWSADSGNYYNTTQIENNFTNYYNLTEVDAINLSMKSYVDALNVSQASWATDSFATIDEPLWTANYSAYNDSWSSTYNSSYQEGYEYTTNGTFVPYTGAVNNVEIGNNNFSVNGTTFFVDSNTGNVGVGTTSPQNTLNVIGEGNFTGDLYSSGDIFALNSSLSDYYLKSNLFGFYNSTNFNISDYATNVKVDSLGNWTLDKQYYYNKTQIENNFTNYYNLSQIENNFTSYFTKTQVLGFDYYNSTNYPNIVDGSGTYGYIPMWNGTNSINNSAIYQNGTNVGIGTTSPSQKLEVEGNVNITQNLTIGGATVFTQGEDMIFRI